MSKKMFERVVELEKKNPIEENEVQKRHRELEETLREAEEINARDRALSVEELDAKIAFWKSLPASHFGYKNKPEYSNFNIPDYPDSLDEVFKKTSIENLGYQKYLKTHPINTANLSGGEQ